MNHIETRRFICPYCESIRDYFFYEKLKVTEVECINRNCHFLGWWNWERNALYDGSTKKQLDHNLYFAKVEHGASQVEAPRE